MGVLFYSTGFGAREKPFIEIYRSRERGLIKENMKKVRIRKLTRFRIIL